MKKKNFLMAIMLLLFSATNHTQTFCGKVVDENSMPIGYATVTILSDKDSTIVQGCVTKEDGMFSLGVAENREYLLQVSFLGYKAITRKSVPVDLGTIVLEPDETVLGEVVVSGHVSAYRAISGGISANVANTVLSKAGTAEDVIGHLPDIRKKTDGTLEVIGKGTPLIYINNRKIRDLTELNRLSSDEVQRIDLITSPGAEYDASVGAVIKIETANNIRDGFSLKALSSAKYAAGINTSQQMDWDYQHKGVELFGSFHYDLSRFKDKAEEENLTYTGSAEWEQRIASVDLPKTQTLFGRIGLNYEVNPCHSFGVIYEITHIPERSMHNNTLTDVRANGTPFDTWTTFDISDEKSGPPHHANAYWAGNFDRFSVNINADMMTGRGGGSESVREYSQNYDDMEADTEERTKNSLLAGKIVLSYPVGKGILSAGSEYTHTYRQVHSTGYAEIIAGTEDKIKDSNIACFLGYDGTFGKTRVNAGLRYEHVTYDFYENGIFSPDESKHYDNVFPTFSLNTAIRSTHLTLDYRIRTERPAYEMLQSAVHYGNRLTYLCGTPDLQPTYIQSLELGGRYRDLQVSVGLNNYKNDIFFVAEPHETNPEISIHRFRNVDRRNELVFSFFLTPTFKWWHPEWMATGSMQWLSVPHLDGQKDLDGALVHFRWGNAFQLPADFLLRADCSWSSPGYSQNQKLKSTGSVNVSLSKDFAHGKWNLMLEANDLLHSIREASWKYDLENIQCRVNKGSTRQVKFTIHYKFNEQKSRYKGTGAGTDEMQRL